MKKIIILVLMISAVLLVGCKNNEDEINEENLLVEEGTKLLEAYKYDEAKDILSDVLEKNEDNEIARAMYMQADRMQKVIRFEDIENYKKAIDELEIIKGIKHGSQIIIKEAKNKIEELKQLNQELEKDMELRKENAKNIAYSEIERVKKAVIGIYVQNKEEELKEKQEEENKKPEKPEEPEEPQEPEEPEEEDNDTEEPPVIIPPAPEPDLEPEEPEVDVEPEIDEQE